MSKRESSLSFALVPCAAQSLNMSAPSQVSVGSQDASETFGLGVVTFVLDFVFFPPTLPRGTDAKRRMEEDLGFDGDTGGARRSHSASAARIFSNTSIGIVFENSRSAACNGLDDTPCVSSRHSVSLDGLGLYERRAAERGDGLACWHWTEDSNEWSGTSCKPASWSILGSGDSAIATVQCACNAPGFFVASFDPPILAETLNVQLVGKVENPASTKLLVTVVCLALSVLLGSVGVTWWYITISYRRFMRNTARTIYLWSENYIKGLDSLALAAEPDTRMFWAAVNKFRIERRNRRAMGVKGASGVSSVDASVSGEIRARFEHPEDAQKRRTSVEGVFSTVDQVRKHVGGHKDKSTTFDRITNTSAGFANLEVIDSDHTLHDGGWEYLNDGHHHHGLDVFFDGHISEKRGPFRYFVNEDGLFWREGLSKLDCEYSKMAEAWECWMPRLIVEADAFTDIDFTDIPCKDEGRAPGPAPGVVAQRGLPPPVFSPSPMLSPHVQQVGGDFSETSSSGQGSWAETYVSSEPGHTFWDVPSHPDELALAKASDGRPVRRGDDAKAAMLAKKRGMHSFDGKTKQQQGLFRAEGIAFRSHLVQAQSDIVFAGVPRSMPPRRAADSALYPTVSSLGNMGALGDTVSTALVNDGPPVGDEGLASQLSSASRHKSPHQSATQHSRPELGTGPITFRSPMDEPLPREPVQALHKGAPKDNPLPREPIQGAALGQAFSIPSPTAPAWKPPQVHVPRLSAKSRAVLGIGNTPISPSGVLRDGLGGHSFLFTASNGGAGPSGSPESARNSALSIWRANHLSRNPQWVGATLDSSTNSSETSSNASAARRGDETARGGSGDETLHVAAPPIGDDDKEEGFTKVFIA